MFHRICLPISPQNLKTSSIIYIIYFCFLVWWGCDSGFYDHLSCQLRQMPQLGAKETDTGVGIWDAIYVLYLFHWWLNKIWECVSWELFSVYYLLQLWNVWCGFDPAGWRDGKGHRRVSEKGSKPKIVHYEWYTIFMVHTVFQVIIFDRYVTWHYRQQILWYHH